MSVKFENSLKFDTPVEKYQVGGKTVYVKRDDLMGDGVDSPAWGKFQAILEIFNNVLFFDKKKPLAHLVTADNLVDTWGLSRICASEDIELRCVSAKGVIPSELLGKLKENGSKVKEVSSETVSQTFREIVKKRSCQRLPYKYNCEPFVRSISKRMRQTYERSDFKTLVVSADFGVVACGLAREFFHYQNIYELVPSSEKKVYIPCSSTDSAVLGTFSQYGVDFPNQVFIEPVKETNKETPFPTDANGRAAWKFLTKNLDGFLGEILFWNITGENKI
jgi:hypothetical protein